MVASIHERPADWRALTASFDALPLPTAVKSAGGEVLYANGSFHGLLRATPGSDPKALRLEADPPVVGAEQPWLVRTKWTWLPRADGVMLQCLALLVRIDERAGLTAYLLVETRLPLAGQPESPPPTPRMPEPVEDRVAQLTGREREVLDRLLSGMSNKAVARDLGISPRTIEVHRGRVLRKLGVHSIAQAARVAAASGVSRPDDPYAV